MKRIAALVLPLISALMLASLAPADVQLFPSIFKNSSLAVNGTEIFVRVGGRPGNRPVARLWRDGRWSPLAVALMSKTTVIVPDLRGMGLSSCLRQSIQAGTNSI